VAVLAHVLVASAASREPHDQIMTGRREPATAFSGGGPLDAATRDADLHAGRYVGFAGFGYEQPFDVPRIASTRAYSNRRWSTDTTQRAAGVKPATWIVTATA
jgi:hypothetical protein